MKDAACYQLADNTVEQFVQTLAFFAFRVNGAFGVTGKIIGLDAYLCQLILNVDSKSTGKHFNITRPVSH